jgi:DNA-binding transcriptional regulator YhcF (GntR family)
MSSAAESLIRENYSRLAPALLSALTDYLIVSRRQANDLDRQLVLLIIMLRSAMARGFADLPSEQVLSGELESLPTLWTNIRSIADSTGIPRETVRRKVNDLIQDGLVKRSGQLLTITPRAFPDNRFVVEKFIRLAAVSHSAVEKVIENDS